MFLGGRMTRRSTAAKTLTESTHPWTVDIPVPLDGLGTRLTDMVDWCGEQGFGFAVHGHREHRAGDVPYDAMRFYFIVFFPDRRKENPHRKRGRVLHRELQQSSTNSSTETLCCRLHSPEAYGAASGQLHIGIYLPRLSRTMRADESA